MILDSSAIVAIIRAEPEREAFLQIVQRADQVSVGASIALESAMVLGPDSFDPLMTFCAGLEIEVVPFDRDHLSVAHSAFVRFGKGGGSKAQLNYGDCMSYALAKVRGEPLLFKGEDFTHTDIEAAWLPPK